LDPCRMRVNALREFDVPLGSTQKGFEADNPFFKRYFDLGL
jgi:hypothetical protein